MKSEATLRFQEKLHRDMEAHALRNAQNGARYAAAWHAWLRGERPTEPTHEEFEISPGVASAIARQCALVGRTPCAPAAPRNSSGISTASASVATGDVPAAEDASGSGTSVESPGLAQPSK